VRGNIGWGVFETRVLRKIFDHNKDEVTGERRRLHNKGLNNLYTSPDTIGLINFKKMRWAGRTARMGYKKGAYRVSVGKPEGKRLFARPRRRWEDYKTDFNSVGRT
jgi:hypothetical protein